MASDNFTNARRNASYTGRSRPAPYASASYRNGLTDKEKTARKLQKMTIRTASEYGFATNPIGGASTVSSGAIQFFSPQLSTDFLELPQSLRERREVYRHYYNSDPIVGQAIDLHTELPLSKIRLATPKPTTCPEGFESPEDYGKYILTFFERMCKRIKLFTRLVTSVHHYWLDGSCFIWAEDGVVDVPEEIGFEKRKTKTAYLTATGEAVEEESEHVVERSDREELELKYYQKNYKGWDKLVILPIDQVKVTTYSFTDKFKIELIPSERDRQLIEQAKMGDEFAAEMSEEIPSDVREHLEHGNMIPLGTDPDEGSFVYHLAAKKAAGEELGNSILNRCLRVLTFREKLRQAQTQIASRAMTPKRIVWAEGLSEADVDELREQVDLALVDPDYSIVTNYELHWEDIGARDRLLDLGGEYEQTERQLLTGLGVTESLMSGEAIYSGDRLKLEVINTRYLFLREVIQEFVEEYIFKPVARRKGFVEKDKWGEEVVIFPKLSFTRLPLRDSQDTYDALFNLYQKGSLDISVILDMFNIDPYDTKEKIERDMFTVNDSTFNEVVRTTYGEVGRMLAEKTDIMEKISQYLGLKVKEEPAAEAEGRF
jgi:hypothetical protein